MVLPLYPCLKQVKISPALATFGMVILIPGPNMWSLDYCYLLCGTSVVCLVAFILGE